MRTAHACRTLCKIVSDLGAGWKEPVPHPPERDGGRVPGKLLLCPGSEAGAASKDHRKLPDGIRGERGQERDGKAGL